MAFIILKEDVHDSSEEVAEAILEKCRKELKEHEVPKYTRIVEELPYTPNGKYDFRALEKRGNKLVCRE